MGQRWRVGLSEMGDGVFLLRELATSGLVHELGVVALARAKPAATGRATECYGLRDGLRLGVCECGQFSHVLRSMSMCMHAEHADGTVNHFTTPFALDTTRSGLWKPSGKSQVWAV